MVAVKLRSEERRVGKECRSRGFPSHQKKKARKNLNRESAVKAAALNINKTDGAE